METWWPAIAVALAEQVTNARTEGFNRIIKQVKRVGCGFATWTTINAASWPTSQSSDREDKRHDQATPRGARVHSFYLPCRRAARSDPFVRQRQLVRARFAYDPVGTGSIRMTAWASGQPRRFLELIGH
jgi:transposase